MMARRQSWLSTTGRSRTAKVIILIVAMAFGFTVAIVSEKAFGVEAKGPCADVRPESSRMACRYDHGHTRARQTYPAHFVRLAKRAHRRWERHHSKVALTGAQLEMRATTWWARVSGNFDSCIAYYAARSRCPAEGLAENKRWMNHVTDITLTCGSSTLLVFFASGGPADPPGAMVAVMGTGGVCLFQNVIHWGIWG
jgi:hypothetical protein